MRTLTAVCSIGVFHALKNSSCRLTCTEVPAIMLTILMKQSQLLEKELFEDRAQMEVLKRRQAEHDAVVKEKDEKIAELEEELSKRRPLDQRVLCVACGRVAGEVEEEEAAPEPKKEPEIDTAEILAKLELLKKKLMSTETKLTSAELQKAILELQLETKTSKIRRELTRDLENIQARAREALATVAKTKEQAQAAERKLSDEIATKGVQIREMQDGLKRRDEQIEFLMQVHDASKECEWVPVLGTPSHDPSHAPSASTAGTSVVPGAVRGAGGSPYAAARHINSGLGSGGGGAGHNGAGGAAVAELTFGQAVAALGPWQCHVCTLRNEAARTLCEACGSDRFQ